MTIDASAVARVVGIDTVYKDLRAGGVLFLPQRIAVFAQGNTAATFPLTKFLATSAAQVGALMGYGSPAHRVVKQLKPVNGDGVGTIPVTVYPMDDAYDSAAATGSYTPSGTQTKAASYRARIGGVLSEAFVVDASATVAARCASLMAAINAVLDMPVVASGGVTSVVLTAKWAGETGNDITAEIIGESLGTTWAIVQPTGGLVNPTVDAALLLVGNVWETMVINALNVDDEVALDAFQVFGEGRWGELVRKPLVVFTGNTLSTVALATAISETRTDDRINAQLVSPGSVDMPFVVAARQVARIAKLANNNPPHDYGSLRATGLIPGDDAVVFALAVFGSLMIAFSPRLSSIPATSAIAIFGFLAVGFTVG